MKFYKYLIFLMGITFMFYCGKGKNPFLFFPDASNENSSQANSSNSLDYASNENSSQANSSNSLDSTNGGNDSNIQNNDQYGNLDYDFQTVINVGVNISVKDPDGPVSGAVISITEPNQNQSLYQAVTNSNGVVTGSLQVSTSLQYVNVSVQVGDINLTFQIPVSQLNQYLIMIDRVITFNEDVNNNNIVDSDQDGTPDNSDVYPNDPTRATKVVFPSSGLGVVAFEDLFPRPGDADFNDVVLKIAIEEDLNTGGQLVRIRGNFQFLAKGAGYNHSVFIKLPSSGTVIQKVYNRSGSLVSQINTHVDSLQRVPLFLKDSLFFSNPVYTNSSLYRTSELCSWNSGTNNVYTPCYSSELEIIFDQPQSKQNIQAPYDLYIYVYNTSKEIHFPNLYFNNDGSDKYLDVDGFPWALLVPEKWNWPFEGKYITTGYPCFDEWYLSRGVNFTDWYVRTNSSSRRNLFPYYADIEYQTTEGCQ